MAPTRSITPAQNAQDPAYTPRRVSDMEPLEALRQYQACRDILLHRGMDGPLKLVYLLIREMTETFPARSAYGGGEVPIAMDTLAAMAGIDARTLRRYIDRLDNAGLLVYKLATDSKGHRQVRLAMGRYLAPDEVVSVSSDDDEEARLRYHARWMVQSLEAERHPVNWKWCKQPTYQWLLLPADEYKRLQSRANGAVTPAKPLSRAERRKLERVMLERLREQAAKHAASADDDDDIPY